MSQPFHTSPAKNLIQLFHSWWTSTLFTEQIQYVWVPRRQWKSSKSCMSQLVTDVLGWDGIYCGYWYWWQQSVDGSVWHHPSFPFLPFPPQNIHRHHQHNNDDEAVEWRWLMQSLTNGAQVLRWLSTWSSPLMESHEEERGIESLIERVSFVTGLEDPWEGSNLWPKWVIHQICSRKCFESVAEEEEWGQNRTLGSRLERTKQSVILTTAA